MLNKIHKSIMKLLQFRIISLIGFVIKYIYITIFTSHLKEIRGKWKKIPVSDEYYVYFTRASESLPYNIPHILSHNKPSYVWFFRNRMINSCYLPEHINYLSENSIPAFPAQLAFRRLIIAFKKQLETNPDAIMHVYTDKIYALYLFHKHRVPENNYTISNYTYGIDTIPYFARAITSKYEYDKQVHELKKILTKRFSHWEPIVSGPMGIEQSFLMTVLFKNQEYLCPNSEKIPEFTSELAEEKGKIRVRKVVFSDIINILTPDRIDTLYLLLDISRYDYDALFLKTTKPCLIIVGTLSTDIYNIEANLMAIRNMYGDKYNLFYKPHPTHKVPGYRSTYDREKDAANENKIVVLPADLPLEFILHLYPETLVGGYMSVVLLSGLEHRVKFLITDKKWFSNANIMPKEKDDSQIKTNTDGSILAGLRENYKYFYDCGIWPGVKFLWEGTFS